MNSSNVRATQTHAIFKRKLFPQSSVKNTHCPRVPSTVHFNVRFIFSYLSSLCVAFSPNNVHPLVSKAKINSNGPNDWTQPLPRIIFTFLYHFHWFPPGSRSFLDSLLLVSNPSDSALCSSCLLSITSSSIVSYRRPFARRSQLFRKKESSLPADPHGPRASLCVPRFRDERESQPYFTKMHPKNSFRAALPGNNQATNFFPLCLHPLLVALDPSFSRIDAGIPCLDARRERGRE